MTTPLEFWAFKGNDNTGQPPDSPDVHQSLLSTRDRSAALLGLVNKLLAELATLQTEVAAIKAKVGA